MSAVVIAASDLVSSLCAQLAGEEDLLTFADTEAIQALQAILERRPALIVLERAFAATPRGAALINRVKLDPQLGQARVRVMSHSGDYSREISRPAVAVQASTASEPGPPGARASADTGVAAAPPARPLDWSGTRRAERHRLRTGVEIQVDGNPASVVDLSVVGVQVLSPTILRPNQKVRVTILQDERPVRCRATVAWAKFELPAPSAPPLYRAGVEFLDADHEFIEQVIAGNRP